ncbi:ribosomal protein L16 Arg81 hydroxylase/catechol 2,3-dioxygenase-like lactoylglutathione lyase family enzyme [Streptosporangium becharense]|uniref:Ribosomal protein L16 Arg81 hydroxylase n=1 Tax=Streptosporangium becharense TaxID=1816182 RepID=A0A7W9IEV4_9ACTN|nr:cupin domain-containing protein [Streptosporangium becharense]MBB2909819.1 ribosomal protein L16 Arg81 hydroxylase/catechol 2,3-dioxygenase-like lactoylglutathione lyase family enzyme [Streptosporangium becharense]MBB5819226.1 ribosomal protein L16 Arg81 hydroxylase [Streptosporangium becharense]
MTAVPPPGVNGAWPLTVTAPGPARDDASALASLVHPIDPGAFRTAYWQRRPLHVQGPPDRFRDLFTMADLREAIARQHELGLLIRVSGDHEGDGGAAGAHVAVEAPDVAAHLRRGASICVEPIERAAPRVAELAARLKSELGHHGDTGVKCYLSPHGYGFNTHFDAHVVTTLQLDGHKRWRVSRTPGVPFPLGNAFADAEGNVRYIGRAPSSVRPWERPEIVEEEFAEILLGPGDVLCLPAGTWHSAKAVGHSLAVNISFAPADVLRLLTDAAGSRLREREAWRSGIPASGGDPGEAARFLLDRREELIAELRALPLDGDELAALLATAASGSPGGLAGTAATRMAAQTASAVSGDDDRRLQCVLTVADARTAAEWYGRVLGCRVLAAIPEFGWIELDSPVPGVSIGLSEVPSPGVTGGAVLDFQVDDLEHTRDLLDRDTATPPARMRAVAGVARFLEACDIDGNRLMFYQPDHREEI